MTFDRQPPHDTQAEEAVIASCIANPSVVPAVSAILKPGMFYHEHIGLVFEAVEAVYTRNGEEGVNVVTVARELMTKEQLEGVGGQAFLMDILGRLQTSQGAESYARIVHETATRRGLITVANAAMEAAYREGEDLSPTSDLLIDALGKVNRAASNADRTMNATEVMWEDGLNAAIQAHIENPRAMLGMSTGFRELDFLLSGLQRGNVYVLAAETSIGKSLWVHNLLRNVAPNRTCFIASSEMTRRSVGRRLTYMQAGIDPQIVTRRGYYEPAERTDLERAMAWFEGLGSRLNFRQGRISMAALRLEARAIKARHGLDIVVVDHMDHIRMPERRRGNRTEDLEELNAELHGMAADLDVAVIAVSHLSRGDGSSDKMKRLKNSSAKEQDADVVMFLQPVAWDPTTEEWMPLSSQDALRRRSQDGYQTVEIDVAKNRDGLTGSFTVTMSWNLGGRYFDAADGQQEAMI